MIKKSKISATLFVLCCIFAFFLPLHAHANELSPSAIVLTQGPYVDYLDNGDYIITTIEESSNNLQLASTTKTKNGTKSTSYYNKNHKLLWKFSVTGTFSYTGSSATCTKTTCSFSSNTNAWRKASSSTNKSSNKAIGKICAKQYQLGVCVKTINRTITVTCSKTGTIS